MKHKDKHKELIAAEGDNNNASVPMFNQQAFLQRIKDKRTNRNRRRITSQALSLASKLTTTKDAVLASKLSGAMSLLAIAAGFADDSLVERMIKASNRISGGGNENEQNNEDG